MIAVAHERWMDPAVPLEAAHPSQADLGRREPPGATGYYFVLTGGPPAEAVIDDDAGFDRHVLASILAVAAAEEGAMTDRAGLTGPDLVELLAVTFPGSLEIGAFCGAAAADDDEVVMLRDLLLSQRSSAGEAGRWLAAMIARRAVEPNHLWEDLGLRDRSELTRLLTRHFRPLASRNTQNMRWKRFFYRMLCEHDGFVMCTTPICTQCQDFDLCFGEENGESRMADLRRETLRGSASPSAGVAQPRPME